MKNIEYGTEFLDQLKDKVHEQQWEIERLNNIINELDKLGVKVGRLNIDLINRIDKAIDKLEESQKGLEEWHFDGYDPDLEDIIKILKGEDNENNN